MVEREFLIHMIDDAYVHGHTYFVRDLLDKQIDRLDIRGFCYDGYVVNIHDTQSYFEENMRLLQEENLNALFSPNQIYTKIRDDNPTRYINGSKAKNVMVADGCVIEGEVENSVLFRGVHVGKGAKVKNCVLMQDTVVEDNASVEYVITDKNVRVTEGKSLTGNEMCIRDRSQTVLYRVRNFLYDKIQRQDMTFYSTYRTGDLMTRVTGDLDARCV